MPVKDPIEEQEREELARSIDDARDEVARTGQVPAAEVRKALDEAMRRGLHRRHLREIHPEGGAKTRAVSEV